MEPRNGAEWRTTRAGFWRSLTPAQAMVISALIAAIMAVITHIHETVKASPVYIEVRPARAKEARAPERGQLSAISISKRRKTDRTWK